MGYNTLSANNIEFRYSNNPHVLFENLSFTISQGWTGLAGANGAGKTTLLRLITGELEPLRGRISGPGYRFLCEQKTDRIPPAAEDFFTALYEKDGTAGNLFGRLGLDHDWPYRWDTLSFGERKRLQLACTLFLSPEVLLLDEPTNHLDEETVGIILPVLSEYNGIGLVVSHDRDFLNRLCRGNLFLAGGKAVFRPGTLDQGLALEEAEAKASRHEYEVERKQLDRLKKEARRRRESADRHSRDLSKKGLSRKDSDSRARIDGLRLTGKDSVSVRLKKRMETRVQKGEERLSGMDVPGKRKSGITFNRERSGVKLSGSSADFLFRLSPREIRPGEDRTIRIPELDMKPGERIALTGPNGAGKTTLIKLILECPELKREKVLYLPQEFSPGMSGKLYGDFMALEDGVKGAALSHFYRLNGDPDAVMGSALPSPGEVRKLAVAMGLERSVSLIILDEPTNHLDLPSRAAMEEALGSCGAGLLMVSHDPVFRSRLTSREWRLGRDGDLKICFGHRG